MHKYAYIAWDRNFSYFCDNWRKRESPLARGTPKCIKGKCAAAGDRQTRKFDNLRQLCWQSLLINLAS